MPTRQRPFPPQAVLPPWQNRLYQNRDSVFYESANLLSDGFLIIDHCYIQNSSPRISVLASLNLSADFLLFWDAGNERHIKWSERHKCSAENSKNRSKFFHFSSGIGADAPQGGNSRYAEIVTIQLIHASEILFLLIVTDLFFCYP